ncbi:hypothetical protein ACIP1G_03650 [Pseudomonas sp. NPDC089392]|uniref:hypothetical protein n=1 Tax=Pseudomonas sp. NPDC089392 TaxID=3364459 RepID=UPI00382F05A2
MNTIVRLGYCHSSLLNNEGAFAFARIAEPLCICAENVGLLCSPSRRKAAPTGERAAF